MKKIKTFFIQLFLLTMILQTSEYFCGLDKAYASAVNISNPEIASIDTDNDTITVEFDIDWSASWRDSENYDAVWVFLKYTTTAYSASVSWSHAMLSESGLNPSGFDVGSGTTLEILVPNDKVGCFIQRSAVGTGSVSTDAVRIVWDYAASGLTDENALSGSVALRIFGIEMVYIPEGGFYVGYNSDGSAAADSWPEYGASTSSLAPVISSEAGIEFQNSVAGYWYYNSGGNTGEDADGAIFNISEQFPKGFKAFYLMKYEISQGQYRDFLNNLTRTQQNSRTASQTASQFTLYSSGSLTGRNGIRVPASVPSTVITFGCDFDADGTHDETTDGEWIACNYLTNMDLCAYADWAGLRPMSEFEYEKACRGPLAPVTSEFAWGNTTATQALGPSLSGTNAESSSATGIGLSNHNGAGTDIVGPIRCGFASYSGGNNRYTTGAGYYANGELSGNLHERVVTYGNSTGRGFSGSHGDGSLNSTGNATNYDWPGLDATPSNGITGTIGSGIRGGGYDTATSGDLRMSARADAADYSNFGTRLINVGGRLARSRDS